MNQISEPRNWNIRVSEKTNPPWSYSSEPRMLKHGMICMGSLW
jgi:hypothetical protein